MLTGTIPSAVGLWNGLRVFAIDNNQFTGTIPETIQNWSNIRTVELNSNNLTGSIPNNLCSFVNESDATITVDEGEVDCTCCESAKITTNAPETAVPTTIPTTVSTPPATSNPLATSPVDVTTPFSTIQSYIVSVAPSGGGLNDPNSQTKDAENQAIQWLETNSTFLQVNLQDPVNLFHIRQWYTLLTLYFSTNGPSWAIPWVLSDPDECNLSGVECDIMMIDENVGEQRVVVNIVISTRRVTGRLSPDLALLPYTKKFDISRNLISGSLPSTLIAWNHVTHFDVTTNVLTGTIPDMFQSWSNAVHISVYDNDFVGTIPQSLSSCTFLETLNLSLNNLTGTIPEVLIASTMKMTNFAAETNFLSGTLSALLGTSWSSIQVFNVANNKIAGTIPDALSLWTNATYVDLSSNELTGTIPTGVCERAKSQTFKFDGNLLSVCS